MFAILIAVCVVIANWINLNLTAILPGIIFFPILNGGRIMVSAISSGIVFREKTTKSVWLGCVIGVISIILIAL